MEKSFNDIEGFLTDESFRSWVLNPTPELDDYWLDWLNKNQDKQTLVDQSRAMIQGLNFKEYHPDPESKQRILERVKQQPQPQQRTVWHRRTWLRVAAVLLLLSGAMAALFYFNDTPEPQEGASPIAANSAMKHSNAPGERTQHTLPDGSVVDLNAGSSLEYPSSFDTGMRVVILNGEAFFEVRHDSSRPFKVVTESFEVVVLGTQFNVNTKPSSPTVALVDGKVRLQSNTSAATLELSPSQMALFNKEESTFTATSFDARRETGWKDGYLVFEEASFSEVLEQLRNWYGVDISIRNAPTSTDWSYTASFKQERLEIVLQSMSLLRNFEYQVKNDSLILSFQ